MRLALALLTLLVFAPAAGAAWSGQTLSGAHTFVDDTRLVVSGNGGALAAWRFASGTGNAGRGGYEAAARAPGAAAFGAPTELVPATPNVRPGTSVAGLEAYGRRGALLALVLPGSTS